MENKYAKKAEKSAEVLKIITTFATVVVLTAVIKNIFETPINVAHIINIGKEVFKAFFIYSFFLKNKVEDVAINIKIPI